MARTIDERIADLDKAIKKTDDMILATDLFLLLSVSLVGAFFLYGLYLLVL